MKKMNLLVMSLVSAAALSFTSCSSNDDLAGDNAGQAKVDGFYMTLNVQTPKSDGTRTIVNTPTVDATAAESDVTSGTIYLVDAAGNVVFKKPITESDWKAGKPTQGKEGSTQLKIAVEDVVAGATYKVYFLANATDEKHGRISSLQQISLLSHSIQTIISQCSTRTIKLLMAMAIL